MLAVAFELQTNSDMTYSLQKAFKRLDTGGDGTINLTELQDGLKSTGVTQEEVGEMFAAMDTTGSGFVEYTQFLAAAVAEKDLLTRQRLETAFYRMDSSGDDRLTAADICNLLGTTEKAKVDDFMSLFNVSADGSISRQAFVGALATRDPRLSTSISQRASHAFSRTSMLKVKAHALAQRASFAYSGKSEHLTVSNPDDYAPRFSDAYN